MATAPVVYYNQPLSSTLGTTINVDFSKELTLDHESEVPLLTLLNRLKSTETKTNEFKFAIGRFAPRTDTLTADVAAGAVGATTNFPVTYPEYYNVGDVVEIPNSTEDATHISQLLVVSISGSNVQCVGYDPATYGTASASKGDTIRVLASSMKEGSSGRSSRQTVPTVYNQYTQSFEDYFDVTFIQDKNRQYTDPERVRLREEARKKHALDQEYAFWFMKKVKDVTTFGAGKPRYQMDGLIAQISTNKLGYGAQLTSDKLYDFMIKVHNPMYTGGNKRLVFASGDLLSQVNKMASSAIRISTKDSTWGPNITEVQFAGKVWQFVEAPTLSDARPGWAVVTHPMFMKKRPLIQTRYEMNVQNPIDKFYKDGFYSVNAIEVRLEEVFGLITP